MLIDSHCHLDRLDLSPYDGQLQPVIDRANEQGVTRLLCVGTDMARWDAMLALTEPYPQVRVSAGVHPLSDEIEAFQVASLLEAATHPRMVAIGETGLDYHYGEASCAAQQRSFELHLQVAAQVCKPVIVHTRAAVEDTLRILRQGLAPSGGVLHCFTEDWSMAEKALELGLYISFSGIITFGSAAELREVVRRVPLERILVETDAPYLAPVPYRGRSNEPCYVREVAEAVATIKGLSLEEVAAATSTNFERLFGKL
ncbi:MAG: TatD DNase family protein [Motiliproteus sp.]|jgi:TatD DNase family protein